MLSAAATEGWEDVSAPVLDAAWSRGVDKGTGALEYSCDKVSSLWCAVIAPNTMQIKVAVESQQDRNCQ